ncbi:methylated-DNA--[protein]-cysteine S-methyltransferase [Dysgonomonas sp. 216]|uniref:methylated-DNA--[protein]-cysteine S-methyltransferase n=1 Tax=Dysgonomonas sp. 216 TaxID=2302934 RepID=UPI0013D404B3|nr:methylated-DNA--[protein]-cysteine S-methyltransferase [Dysgonomonas sp. 216]NDW19310.1 methylated-DNA--[protein]-cysteine S-methyltransferase [Dysgonomonas sp. 216]
MKIARSYENIAEDILNPEVEYSCLNKQVVLSRMIDNLPSEPWANIEINDWLPKDEELLIEYSFYNTPFGNVLVANTSKGICYLGLIEGNLEDVLSDFEKRFSYTNRVETQTLQQKQAVDFLNGKTDKLLLFHLRGTPYQIGIWRKLIRIPYGKVISYATLEGSAQFARAAGAANGRNPIFWIIPCHRVVKTDGGFDRYFWGKDVKKRLLGWEFANSKI